MRDIVRRMPGLQVDIHDVSKVGNITWSMLVQYDAVFLQRPYVTVKMMQFIKDLNIPIWIDYDDNLFQIPESNNRAFDTFMDQNVQDNLVEIAGLADVITVSTSALKTMYDTGNDDVRVIPNAIPFDIIGDPVSKPLNRSILWRGGDSHRLDLRIHEVAMYELMEKYGDWQFVYAGFNPYQFTAKNKKYRKPEDPILYFKWIREYAPQAAWIPLHDSFFNRCKSNIAALEGTIAGAVCLVPDWEEWQMPGTLRYKTPDEFREKAEIILNEKVNFKKYRSTALDYIRSNYDLHKVNEKRIELIKELVKW